MRRRATAPGQAESTDYKDLDDAAKCQGSSRCLAVIVTETLGRAPALTYRIVGCHDFSLLANSSQAFAYE